VRGIARPIRTSTLEERRRILTGKDFAAWEHRPFTSITKADIKAVRDSVKERGQVMSRLTLAHLKTLFNWALEADLIEVSPAAGVKSPGGAERDRVLTDDEVAILWHAADSVPTYGDLTKLLLLTGQRVGEVKGIRWEEIDLRERVWNLPGERAKNHIPNIVPLANQAIEILTRIGPKDTGLVFASKKGGVIHDEDRAKKTLDKLVAATAGKPANAFATRWTFHDLRRTVRSGMSKLGVRREIAELVLNHRTGAGLTGVAGVYDRYEYLPEKTQAIARWAASLERLVSGQGEQKIIALQPARG
jgi:integrase